MSEEAFAYRLGRIEESLRDAVRKLDDESRSVARHDEQISGANGLIAEVKDLTAEVANLRRSIMAFALGLPVAGVTFLLGIRALTQ